MNVSLLLVTGKGGGWKAMEWEKTRKEWEGEALLGGEDETWEGDRRA